MNAYAVVILAALLAEFCLAGLADLLTLGALTPELPVEFRAVYDTDRYRRSQEYTRARTRFGILVAALDLAVLLAVWAAGGFRWLDGWVRSCHLGPVPSGLLFIATLVLTRAILRLPARWWSTFVIEARFGFNRTTPATFAADLVKGLALAVVLGVPLLAAILWSFERAGTEAWLWCWLVATVFALGVQYVAPTWIMPLWNRFAPLADGPLRQAILAYARAVAFPVNGIFVIDGSRRSSKANAFFTGFGRHKRIALFDTLVETLDPQALVAVLAHEIGHWKHRHVLVGTLVSIAQMGVVFFALSLVLERHGLFAAFAVETPSVHAGLVFAALLFTPLDLVLSVVGHALSRRQEFAADTFAARTTGSGEPLARGLMRLSADSLANLTPHPLSVVLHYSHPPVLARIRALRAAGAPPACRRDG